MQQEFIEERMDHRPSAPTARDVVAILFRQWKILLLSFVVILLGIGFSGVLAPKYRAEMKILVRRERVDPMVTSQTNAPQFGRAEVTEAELNSEVELLNSSDLLRKVALAAGLDDQEGGEQEVRIARGVRGLGGRSTSNPCARPM